MDAEIWKDIPGIEGYQASNLGRIRSVRVLVLVPDRQGYVHASVLREKRPRKNDRMFVHALVASAFIGPKPEGMQVNHINGVRNDNTISNLEYLLPQENIRHSFSLGNRYRDFSESQMDKIAEWFIEDGLSVTEIARRLQREEGRPMEAFASLRRKVRRVIAFWRKNQRIASGRDLPGSKWIDAATANRIREIYATGKITQRELAKLFSCSSGTVCRIVNQTGERKDMRGKHSKGNPDFGSLIKKLNPRENT